MDFTESIFDDQHFTNSQIVLSNIADDCCQKDLFTELDEDVLNSLVINFEKYLRNSVDRRVNMMRKELSCGILFSGGLDSSVLAALMDQCYPKEREIELVNVAFEVNGSFEAPDRSTSLKALE